MGQWSRAELESAFAAHKQVVVGIGESWNWARFADQFTEDATYVEHMYGKFQGRERIRDWIVKTMSTFPGSEMPYYPSTWHSVDEEKGWVICEFQNRMRDRRDTQRSRLRHAGYRRVGDHVRLDANRNLRRCATTDREF